MSTLYNDPEFAYDQYWQGREYEHQSEILAIRTLLKGKHFAQAADLGGGFGRLTKIVQEFSDQVILVEPSAKMRKMAKGFKTQAATIENTKLESVSQDLVTAFRVLHHVPDLQSAFNEVNRILKPGGYFLFEFANSLNLKARVRSAITGKPILLTPIEMRSTQNIKTGSIPFVNHHPETVLKTLRLCAFEPLSLLSVSNLRFTLLKQVIPLSILLSLESVLQKPLSSLYFGPSIFVLTRKTNP